jgi:hypothetical protein
MKAPFLCADVSWNKRTEIMKLHTYYYYYDDDDDDDIPWFAAKIVTASLHVQLLVSSSFISLHGRM